MLEFSFYKPAAVFKVLPKGMLQEMSTKKCVHRLSNGNRQLVLRDNSCKASMFPVDIWEYNSVKKWLIDVTCPGLMCWSPWANSIPPYDIKILAGLSPCDVWNQVNLVLGMESLTNFSYEMHKNHQLTFAFVSILKNCIMRCILKCINSLL